MTNNGKLTHEVSNLVGGSPALIVMLCTTTGDGIGVDHTSIHGELSFAWVFRGEMAELSQC